MLTWRVGWVGRRGMEERDAAERLKNRNHV